MSLKTQNLPMLIVAALLNLLLLGTLIEGSTLGIDGIKSFFLDWESTSSLATLVSLAVIVATNMMSRSVKDFLVYFKGRQSAPAHRAFSELIDKDDRIDVKRLESNWPEVKDARTGQTNQNSLWYRLFKSIDSSIEIQQSHRTWLLLRDLVALQWLFTLCMLLIAIFYPPSRAASGQISIALLALLAIWLAANNSGKTLVLNVLAMCSVKAAKPEG